MDASIVNKKANANSDTIYYDFNRPLTWNDFKGKPNPNHPGGAVTASGFAFNSQMNSDGRTMYLKIQIYTFFGKSDSWKKPQIGSDYHLLHEQHHFDITRLGAEALVDAISKADFTKENYNSLLTSLFDKANRENSNLQQQYDRETVHSIDTAKQQEWNNKIADEVTKLKENTVDKL
ncbi:MAG: hypothetical protein ABJA90_12235 [Ginsengibacter sp.]